MGKPKAEAKAKGKKGRKEVEEEEDAPEVHSERKKPRAKDKKAAEHADEMGEGRQNQRGRSSCALSFIIDKASLLLGLAVNCMRVFLLC